MSNSGKLSQDSLQEKLLALPIFGGLGKAAVSSLMDFHRFVVCEANTTFVNQGEYTSECCVLLEGLVTVYRSEPGKEGVQKLGTLGPGDWFGEMSALSNQPAMATVRADTRCILVAIDPPLFKDLYKGRNPFKQLIDGKYRERALAAHLRAVPLFKGIPEEKLLALQQGAEFVVLEKDGEVIAERGKLADAIYLIRSGAVKLTARGVKGEELILSYFMDNSSFGEQALAHENREWRGTFTTMTRTDLVKVPAELIERAFADDEKTLEVLRTTADLIVAEELGQMTGLYDETDEVKGVEQLAADRLEILVEKQSIKGGEALVIDLKKCTRCNACVESCVAVHEDRVPRLSKKGSRVSIDMVLSSACYSCRIPECMSGCNDGAIRRDSMGSVRFIYDNCTGCTACVQKCPYDVIRMTPPPGEAKIVPDRGLLDTLPFFGSWFTSKKLEKAKQEAEQREVEESISARTKKKVKAKAIKCDLCAGLPFEACVYNCPCSAISRINPEALLRTQGN